jgi:hypothetical protein
MSACAKSRSTRMSACAKSRSTRMSGLVSDGGSLVLKVCFDGSVLGGVRDSDGAEVFVARPSASDGAHGARLSGGGGGPVQAARADRRIEVGERPQSDAIGAQRAGEDEGVEPIGLVVGRAVAASYVRQLVGADHHDGDIGTFDGDFLDPGIGQEAHRPSQSRRAVRDGAAQLFPSVRVDDRDCATPNFGAGMCVPVRSLIGGRWRSVLSPAGSPGDRRVPRNSSRAPTPSGGLVAARSPIPAWGSDERVREEQIDTDERLREEQIRPMSAWTKRRRT